MATWTLKQTLGGDTTIGAAGLFAPWLTDTMYFIEKTGGIYVVNKWVPATNTKTALSDGASFGASAILASSFPGPVLFGGNLYVMTSGGGQTFVYKYDGAGTAWTLVRTSPAATLATWLFADDTHIVTCSASNVGYLEYSTNGTSWSTGSFAAGGEATVSTFGNNSGDHSLGSYVLEASINSPTDTIAVERIMRWDGVSALATAAFWKNDNGVITGETWVRNYALTDLLHWVDNGDEWGAALVSPFTDAGNNAVNPIRTQNAFKSAGFILGTLYLLDAGTGDWDAGELIVSGAGQQIKHLTLNPETGDAFAITKNSTTSMAIYQRDTQYDLPVGTNFYFTRSAGGVPGVVMV